jgi:hypothetical protein
VAAPILQGASWDKVPDSAPPRWSERSTAMLALASMALRGTRAVALTVRAGYYAEALSDVRRLNEAAGHARQVALDASGQYAENWLHGRGKAGSARAAFQSGSADGGILWKVMSGHSHAEFENYANLSASLDDRRRLVHTIGPRRDLLWDNIALWLTVRQFTTVLASVLKLHSHIDQADFLAAAEQVITAEDRLTDELKTAMRSGSRTTC